MEPRFGRDLGDVRVHTDAAAARAAKMLSANAFTVGRDIHFADGQYRTDTMPGLHLLAHELTHTVQQGGGPGGASGVASSSNDVSDPLDLSEVEADRVADRVASESPVTTGISTSQTMIQGRDDGGARSSPMHELIHTAEQRQGQRRPPSNARPRPPPPPPPRPTRSCC